MGNFNLGLTDTQLKCALNLKLIWTKKCLFVIRFDALVDETESAPNVYAKNRLTKIIIKRLTI